MLTERDIEKQHKIDKVCGNIKGNVNCTYTFVEGRSTSKLYCKPSEQNKTAKIGTLLGCAKNSGGCKILGRE